jgi:Flp pilus assembly protein TadD
MRKNFALFLVAMLALTMAFAAVGCGGSSTTEQTTTEAPATEAPATEMPMDSTAMPADTTAMAH